MKKLMMIGLSLMIFAFVNTGVKAQDNDTNGEVILNCEMDCGACAGKVKKQLAYTKGVKNVKADYVKDEVWVKYRSDKTKPEKLIASLDEIGYEATVKGNDDGSDSKKDKSVCPGAEKAGCKSKKKPCGSQ
ncbi:MAG: cation transporter [Bacteroidota bacterium]